VNTYYSTGLLDSEETWWEVRSKQGASANIIMSMVFKEACMKDKLLCVISLW